MQGSYSKKLCFMVGGWGREEASKLFIYVDIQSIYIGKVPLKTTVSEAKMLHLLSLQEMEGTR
jgi:hypothetical protein